MYGLTSLNKKHTWNSESPPCINSILTNSPSTFSNLLVIETRLSDFHKMIALVIKPNFGKLKYKIR